MHHFPLPLKHLNLLTCSDVCIYTYIYILYTQQHVQVPLTKPLWCQNILNRFHFIYTHRRKHGHYFTKQTTVLLPHHQDSSLIKWLNVRSLRRSEGLEKRPVHCENRSPSQTVSRPRIQPLWINRSSLYCLPKTLCSICCLTFQHHVSHHFRFTSFSQSILTERSRCIKNISAQSHEQISERFILNGFGLRYDVTVSTIQ